MDLSIITVTYQSKKFIEKCILSILTNTLRINYEHIIIDNASTDGTVGLIETSYLPYVTLIKNSKNLGFAKANQIGVEKAKGDFFLFLNPDIEIYEGYLDTLITFMKTREDIGVLGCKLLDFQHAQSIKLMPTKSPLPSLWFFYLLNLRTLYHPKNPWLNQNFNMDIEQEVDCLRGAFMLIPRKIYELLGFCFDPAYFILMEDLDICQEVKRLGYKVFYNPQVHCIDFYGRSFFRTSSLWRYLQLSKSIQIYARKWYSPWHLLWIYPLRILGIFIRLPYLLKTTKKSV